VPITFDAFSAARTVTPKTATAGADAGSSRTAPAGDGFGRLVQALSGQPGEAANEEPNETPAAPVPGPIAHTLRALVARVHWGNPLASGTGGEVVPDKVPDKDPRESDTVIDTVDGRDEDHPPLANTGGVLVDPILQTLTTIPVVAINGEVRPAAPATSDAKVEGDSPSASENPGAKAAPPIKHAPVNPKEDQDETPPAAAEPDRNTKLPPLATGKTELDLQRGDGRPAPPTRAADAPAAADIAKRAAGDTTAPLAAPTREHAQSVASRVAADSAFSAGAAARRIGDVSAATARVLAASTAAPGTPAAPTGVPVDVAAGVVAAANAHVPQTPDARRADEARLTADRATAFSRTSPRVSLNDLATADRVERPASSIFDARASSDARPAAERAYATMPVPVPVLSAQSAAVSNVTIASTLERESASVATQIVDSIRLQWTRGGGEAQVTLEPKYLGPLTVNVRIDRDVVSATVIAETPAVREWLRANEALLRQGLSEQGLRLDRLEIAEPAAETPHRDQDSHGRPRDRDEQPRQPKRHDTEGAVFDVIA
jgi:flagellar hook-length control protein FliK